MLPHNLWVGQGLLEGAIEVVSVSIASAIPDRDA
jgi:hypothetical protein